MNKYILLGLFLLNFAFAFEGGKCMINVGEQLEAQNYSKEYVVNCNFNDELIDSYESDCEIYLVYQNMEVCDNGQTDAGSITTTSYTDQACVDAKNDGRCPDGSYPCVFCGQCGCEGSCRNPDDCAGVAGGSAYWDHCEICVGGDTGLTACKQDCAGVWGGEAYRNDCQECVGGTTQKVDCSPFCFPKQFNIGMSVTAYPNYGTRSGYGWCSFFTLATLKGGDPCTYASYYYSTFRPEMHIDNCNSTLGAQTEKIQPFYENFGVVYEPSFAVSDNCTLINQITSNGGGKGILVQSSDHIFLLYNFYRPNENTDIGDILVSKYDTSNGNGWDSVVKMRQINFAGTVDLIH